MFHTSLLLTTLVLLPELTGILDVLLLAHFGPTAEQDYQGVSVSAEIDPVAWADVYAAL